MAVYSNFTLTGRGMDLFSDLLKGSGEMEFRHLAAGSGTYGEAERGTEYIRGMECLKEERQRIPFASVKKEEGGAVGLKADLSNKGNAEGYYITEIGIYAGKKGEADEILYCVATTDNPDYMPDGSSGRNYNVIFRTLISLGDAEEITVNYTSDSYVSAEDFQEAVASLRQEVTQALGDKADVEDGKGLSSNDYTDEDREAVGGLNGLAFGQDADGNWGYKAPGAEEVVPFGGGSGPAPVVLWENEPYHNIGEETVTLSDYIGNYSYYEVIFKISTTSSVQFSSGKVPCGQETVLQCSEIITSGSPILLYYRQVYPPVNFSMTFRAGYAARIDTGEYTVKEGSTMAVPLKVLGYKR